MENGREAAEKELESPHRSMPFGGSGLEAMKTEHPLGHVFSVVLRVDHQDSVPLRCVRKAICLMVRRGGSETRMPKFISQSCHLRAVLSWANYSTSVPSILFI